MSNDGSGSGMVVVVSGAVVVVVVVRVAGTAGVQCQDAVVVSG